MSPMIGLVHWITFDGVMTCDIFGNFLMQASKLLQYNGQPYVLFRDNVSSHLNPVNFGDQGEIMYLPRFSTWLKWTARVSKRLWGGQWLHQKFIGNLWSWWWWQTKRCRNAAQLTNSNHQTGIWKRYPNDHGQQMWGIYVTYIIIHTTIYSTGPYSWLNQL